MTEKANSRTIKTIALGNVKVTIREFDGLYGTYRKASVYSVYKKADGTYGSSSSFGVQELLAVAHLAGEVVQELQEEFLSSGDDVPHIEGIQA